MEAVGSLDDRSDLNSEWTFAVPLDQRLDVRGLNFCLSDQTTKLAIDNFLVNY